MNKDQSTSSEHQVQDEVINHPKTATLLGEELEIKGIAIPAVNKEFDNMVDEISKTKPEKEQEQKVVEKKEEKPYTPEQAAGVVLMGLNSVMGLVGKLTNIPINLGQETQMVFAAMTTPLVMKYGQTIKGLLNPENVDLDSNIPEYLAIAAVGVIAVPSYLQVKEFKKLTELQGHLSEAGKKANETGKPQAVNV